MQTHKVGRGVGGWVNIVHYNSTGHPFRMAPPAHLISKLTCLVHHQLAIQATRDQSSLQHRAMHTYHGKPTWAHHDIISTACQQAKRERDITMYVHNLCLDHNYSFDLCPDHKFLHHLVCPLAIGVAHQMPSCPHQVRCGAAST